MPAADLAALSTIVLIATFALAFAFGAIVQRTNFCTMGSVADIVNFGDWTRMRQWLLAIAVAIAGTTLLDAAGLIDVRRELLHLAPLHAAGLCRSAGSCSASAWCWRVAVAPSRWCAPAQAASSRSSCCSCSAVVAYMTLRGALAAVSRGGARTRSAFTLPSRQDLPSLLARSAAARGRVAARPRPAAVARCSHGFALRDRSVSARSTICSPAWASAAVIVAVWFVSGHIGHVDEHPQTLEEVFLRTNSRQMESLSFVAPVAWTLDYLMFASDTSKELTIGIVAVIGMFTGSAAYAWQRAASAGRAFATPKTPPTISSGPR